MKIALSILLVVLVVLFIILAVMYSSQWGDSINAVILSFNEFYKYYCLNPDSWNIGYYNLTKKKENKFSSKYYCRIKFLSYWRYCIFVFLYKRGRYNKACNDAKIEFLQSIQQDIDNCRKEAEKYNKQGIDILNEVVNNSSKK